ncbi:MAG: hypothetical protein OET90_03090 [Desulfuromonadales bacterium]|nr:hypothetical protein [Desulfuromonadales bacterium]
MEIIWQIALMLLSVLLSALLGWILAEPHRIKSWFSLLTRSSLTGADWITEWQSNPYDLDHWTRDEVRLTHRLGKLHIVVINSSDDYNWETSLLKRGHYFIGTFRSLKENATACGSLTLRLCDQGECFAGYHSGPTKKPRIMSGKVIIAKESNLEFIKENFADYL